MLSNSVIKYLDIKLHSAVVEIVMKLSFSTRKIESVLEQKATFFFVWQVFSPAAAHGRFVISFLTEMSNQDG